jgi:hypothetical protein
MYFIAIMGDIFSFIPGVNIVSDFVTGVALGIAGSETGLSLYASDQIAATLATMLVEAVPGLSIVPTWTIRVYFRKRFAKKNATVAS